MKAREVRELGRGNIDPISLKIMESIAEELSTQKLVIAELAKQLERAVETLIKMQRVMGVAMPMLERLTNDKKSVAELRMSAIESPEHLEEKLK